MRIYPIRPRFLDCFLLALLFFTSNVNSQEFAPIGATWIYQNTLPVYPAFPVLVRFTSERDTIINQRHARIIVREELYLGGEWKYFDHEIVSSSGDSVFVFNDNEFKLIFDYTREAGDTVVVIDKPFEGFYFDLGPVSPKFKHFKYRIDSILNEAIGDDIVIKQFVSYLENPIDSLLQWGFQSGAAFASVQPPALGRILEGVGSLGFDTPFGSTPNISYVGSVELQELTCYSDSLRTFNFSGIDCDSLVEVFEKSSTVIDNEINNIEIFPNPFTSILNIKIPYFHDYKILIFDIRGAMVATMLGGEEAYDLSHLGAGTYMIKVISKERSYKVFKVNKL